MVSGDLKWSIYNLGGRLSGVTGKDPNLAPSQKFNTFTGSDCAHVKSLVSVAVRAGTLQGKQMD